MRAPDDHDTNEEIIYMLQKENDSLRSQLEEAQEKLKATGIEAEVCGDITNRQQLRIAKYGQTVADNPAELGEWIQHAYEETLDNAVYLRRALQAIRSASQV